MAVGSGSPSHATTQSHYEPLTGPGPAAIAVVRVTGPATGRFLQQHVRLRNPASEQTWQVGRVWRAVLLDREGVALDDILVSVHAGPPAWDVRVHLHANPRLVDACVEMLARTIGFEQRSDALCPVTELWVTTDRIASEAYTLLPSVLTLRGAGRLLTQVEILRNTIWRWLRSDDAALVRAECAATAERAKLWKCFTVPARVALVGPPNAGKSTLLNALTESSASIVSTVAGTTRDWVDVPGECDGFPVTWIDTAGIRPTTDALELAGVAATRRIIAEADGAIFVLDGDPRSRTRQLDFVTHLSELLPETAAGAGRPRRFCVVVNKSDLAQDEGEHQALESFVQVLVSRHKRAVVAVSALRGTNLDGLRASIARDVLQADLEPFLLPCAFTTRQVDLLKRAAGARDRERQACLLELLGRSPAA